MSPDATRELIDRLVRDRILLSGSIADHGIAILSVREGLEFETRIESDTACLWPSVRALLDTLGVEIREARTDKDESDMELCLLTALERGVERITIVGALYCANQDFALLANILGAVGITFAMINVVGGFAVTRRMLVMFGGKK